MILKITDGTMTHYLDGFDEVRVVEDGAFDPGADPEDGYLDLEGTEPLYLFCAHEPSEEPPVFRDVVILQPTMGPKSLAPRTIVTDFDVYLLNDQGKTVEIIHRAK